MADHLATIQRYYHGCNTGDVELIMSTCTPDVVHYFFVPGTDPVAGHEHLARYWRKVQRMLQGAWFVDHALVQQDEAVIEWTLLWTAQGSGQRHAIHGTEWYRFQDGLISEIRAYYDQRPDTSTGLVGFPYRERGYTLPESS